MQHQPIVCYRYVISYYTVLSLLVSFNKDLDEKASYESEIKRGWRSRLSCLSRLVVGGVNISIFGRSFYIIYLIKCIHVRRLKSL